MSYLERCSSNAWQCRKCGCDDMHACMDRGVPCHWVAPHLCSACARRRTASPARRAARQARRILALRVCYRIRRNARAFAWRRVGSMAGRGGLPAALRVQRARKGR